MFKTITLTGSETAVKFDKQYPYFWARNLGESDVYMSVKPGIIPDSDSVIFIPTGGGASTEYVGQVDNLFFLGSGKIEVSAQFNGICPFFKSRKGGVEKSGKKFILNYDDECAENSGGWTDNITTIKQGLASTQTGYVMSELGLYRNYVTDSFVDTISFLNRGIDLTNHSNLHIRYKCEWMGYSATCVNALDVYIMQKNPQDFTDKTTYDVINSSIKIYANVVNSTTLYYDVDIDISAYSGIYFIGFYASLGRWYIHKIYLE